MDPTSIGHLGTLLFLRARDPEQVVTAFPIDTTTVTIGREPSCDIRLYYPDVSGLHCKIVFQERKAFIVVLGQNGLLVDDCAALPSDTSAHPTTIPLANGSTLEIRSKRFRFEYPPKHARAAAAAALSTPAPMRRRLSLITASKVFSPSPSSRPAENLRILQSPLRPYAGTVQQPSPLRGRGGPSTPEEDEDVEEEEVVLVDGDHPRVVQEDKDLVIMEDIPPPTPAAGQPRHLAPPSVQQTLQTPPRRKPAGRPSLHRAVLLRSAHRIVQDQAEEMEIEQSIILGEDAIDESADEEDEEDVDENGEAFEEEYARLRDDNEQPQPAMTGWRQSIGPVWPFGRKSQEPEEEMEGDSPEEPIEQEERNMFDGVVDPAADEDMEGGELDDEPEPELKPEPPIVEPIVASTMPPPSTPIAGRRLGHFMTPQGPHPAPFAPATALRPLHTPRRAVDAWRVRDLVLPSNTQPAPAARLLTARKVSAEEEREIRARRKSAMLGPLSPLKPSTSSKPSLASTKEDPAPAGPSRRAPRESDESDSGALLASMRRTVDDLRRRSLGTTLTPGGPGTSPRKKGGFSLFPAPADELLVMKGALDFGKISEDSDGMAVDEDKDELGDEQDPLHIDAPQQLPSPPLKDKLSVAQPPAPMPAPETPDLASLKHIFAAPHVVGAATPAVKSIRGLYTQPRLLETPTMEGIAEMLAPPPVHEPKPGPSVENRPPTLASTRSRSPMKNPAPEIQDTLEPEPEPELVVVPELEPSAPKSRKPPSSRSAPAPMRPPSRTSASKDVSTPRPAAAVTRAAPGKAPRSETQLTPDASTMPDDDELTLAAPEARPRQVKKAAEAGPSTKPAAATVKRRKPPGVRPEELDRSDGSRPPSRAMDATADSAPENKPALSKPAPSKTTKPPSKAKAPTPATAPAPTRRTRPADAASSEPAPPATAPQPARRSTRTTPSRGSTAASDDGAGATRVRQTVRGKPDVEPIAEQDDEDTTPPLPRAPSRSGMKTPAAVASTRTWPLTRKTPVTSASSEGIAVGDKENTPDGASSSTVRDDESEGSGGNAQKATRTRSLKTLATKETEDASAPTRGTRVTRTKK